MEIELKEIRDFIAAIPPFDRLSQEKLDELTRHLSIEYVRRGRTVPSDPGAPPRLYILRRGAVAMYSGHNTLMGMLGEGDICTSFCAAQLMPDFSVRTTEDTLFYTIPCDELTALIGKDPSVLHFVRHSAAQRLKEAVTRMQEQSQSSLLHSYTGDFC